MSSKRRRKRAPLTELPILEAFGYSVGAATPQAAQAKADLWCPFAGNSCEKYRQYRFGYCSVTYAGVFDDKRYTYAVCDHRLDGAPVQAAIDHHFGPGRTVTLVPEVVVPIQGVRTSLDYAAVLVEDGKVKDIIVIETQAVDIRGGGVGPAWRAWYEGTPEKWREFFSAEAAEKGRKDTVAYGVNLGNVYKRLGLQIALKGQWLKRIGVPLYVVMQDRVFEYLRRRIDFAEAPEKAPADITFVTSDYKPGDAPAMDAAGMLAFGYVKTVRTTLESYTEAMARGETEAGREEFLLQIQRKIGLEETGAAAEGIDEDMFSLTVQAGGDLTDDGLSE